MHYLVNVAHCVNVGAHHSFRAREREDVSLPSDVRPAAGAAQGSSTALFKVFYFQPERRNNVRDTRERGKGIGGKEERLRLRLPRSERGTSDISVIS